MARFPFFNSSSNLSNRQSPYGYQNNFMNQPYMAQPMGAYGPPMFPNGGMYSNQFGSRQQRNINNAYQQPGRNMAPMRGNQFAPPMQGNQMPGGMPPIQGNPMSGMPPMLGSPMQSGMAAPGMLGSQRPPSSPGGMPSLPPQQSGNAFPIQGNPGPMPSGALGHGKEAEGRGPVGQVPHPNPQQPAIMEDGVKVVPIQSEADLYNIGQAGQGPVPGGKADADGRSRLKQYIQNERNSRIFYNHLAQSANHAGQKKFADKISRMSDENCNYYKKIYQQTFGEGFEPEDEIIDTRVGFSDGVRMGIEAEIQALQDYWAMKDQAKTKEEEENLEKIIRNKICMLNYFHLIKEK